MGKHTRAYPLYKEDVEFLNRYVRDGILAVDSASVGNLRVT